jgi:outer membrane lipoprotein carrier protein
LRITISKIAAFFFATLGCFPALADDDVARARVEQFVASAERYSARFTQELIDENGEILEESQGEFWLARPGKFRWHYAPPLERILVSDGERIWLYDVELDQVTVRDAEGELEKTPAGILVGDTAALENYSFDVRVMHDDYAGLGMRPVGSQSDFADIVLGLKGNELRDLRLKDRFGQTTVIRFSDVRANPDVPGDRFTLEIPPGVDVIDQSAAQ